MTSRTVTCVMRAPHAAVFDYVSDVENLPRWATEFARELRFEGGQAKVVNGLGEFWFRIDADRDTGVVDMYAGPAQDRMALFPTRVVPLGDDTSAYTFTMFQAPDMPDDLFEAQYRSLLRELEVLRARLEA